MRKFESLSNLIRAFKKCVQAFGCAPFEYDKEYSEMTQLQGSQSQEVSVDDGDGDRKRASSSESGMVPVKKRSRLSRCHEHLNVSRAMQNALAVSSAVTAEGLDQGNNVGLKSCDEEAAVMTKKDSFQQAKSLNRVAKEFEKVVELDKKALIEEAAHRGRKIRQKKQEGSPDDSTASNTKAHNMLRKENEEKKSENPPQLSPLSHEKEDDKDQE